MDTMHSKDRVFPSTRCANGAYISREKYDMGRISRQPNIWRVLPLIDVVPITKQFTAAAILLLAERGKLDVTDQVSFQYSTPPKCRRDVTISYLLTHISRIPSFTSLSAFPNQIVLIERAPDQFLNWCETCICARTVCV